MMEILKWPNPALATKCEPIAFFEGRLYKQLDAMWQVLDSAEDLAMGLAANQVGILNRVFIMRDQSGVRYECINPEWTGVNRCGVANMSEGCLSTPGMFEVVPNRQDRGFLKFQNRRGQSLVVQAEGLEAVCAQHEIDHLDGIFWFDRMPRNPRRRMISRWKKTRGKS